MKVILLMKTISNISSDHSSDVHIPLPISINATRLTRLSQGYTDSGNFGTGIIKQPPQQQQAARGTVLK